MAIKLSKVAAERGIEYFLISFIDLFGSLRSKLVPARAIDDMQKDGAGFAGFAAWLDMTPAHPDMFAIPDPDSLIQLPWNKEVAWLASDLWMDGKPVEASPRVALKRQLAEAEKLGFESIVISKYSKFKIKYPQTGDIGRVRRKKSLILGRSNFFLILKFLYIKLNITKIMKSINNVEAAKTYPRLKKCVVSPAGRVNFSIIMLIRM